MLLAAHRMGPTGLLEPLSLSELTNAWASLRSKHAADFQPSGGFTELSTECGTSLLPSAAPTPVNYASLEMTQNFGIGVGELAADVPLRDAKLSPNLLDLSRYYNASLIETWQGSELQDTLSCLKPGMHNLAGVEFDVPPPVVGVGSAGLGDLVPPSGMSS